MNPFINRVCYTCIARLALYLSTLSSDNEREIVVKALELAERFAKVAKSSLDDYVELSAGIAEVVAEELGDPYSSVKRISMEAAFRLLPIAERYVSEGGDPLRRAASVAVAGNALDFATGVYSVSLSDFAAEFERRLREPFAIDHLDQLERDLEAAETVLYVLDNAGECVLDLPLVKLLSQRARIVVAARGAAVFNDATLAEAEEAGLGEYAKLTTTGCRVPGVSARRCSPDFLRLLAEADVAILKGQGNFQSFTEVAKIRGKPAYYLLVPKCEPVARYLGVPVGCKVAVRR
ncbi:MAG: ARMT1-like domain-containing protein [Thermofilaceae archaeon]